MVAGWGRLGNPAGSMTLSSMVQIRPPLCAILGNGLGRKIRNIKYINKEIYMNAGEIMEIEISAKQIVILEKLIEKESDYNDVIRTKSEKNQLIRYLRKNKKILHDYWFAIYDIIGTWMCELPKHEQKIIQSVYDKCAKKLCENNCFTGQTLNYFA